jgi:cytochrome P450
MHMLAILSVPSEGTRVPTRIDFDHLGAKHTVDPIGSFDELRRRCPVAYSSRYGGFWVLTRYEDVFRVIRDVETFSAGAPDGLSVTPPLEPHRHLMPPLELDPPEYIPYRRLLEPFLTPHAVETMEPGITLYVDYLLDQVIEQGEMDFMADLALPLPTIVTMDWLGLPTAQWRYFSDVFHDHSAAAGTADAELMRERMREMSEVLRAALEERRREPRADVLTVIATATIDGRPIPGERALGLAELTMAGGINTTGDLTAHAIVYLDEHRDVHRALLEDDHLMRTATEELLRIVTPVLSFGRCALADAVVGGENIHEGDRILVSWAAANRDGDVFDRPNEVDLTRWPNRHVSFGLGPHRCIGSNLARAMFRIAVRRVLERMQGFRVVETALPRNRAVHNHIGSMRVAFSPGERVLDLKRVEPQFATLGAPAL